MDTTDSFREARKNLMILAENPYPGRGIVIGLHPKGKHIIMAYWIMGRSENSRNRLFDYDNEGRLFTVAADESKVKDPSLIIYNAMFEAYGAYVVSNGDQTDTVIDELAATAGIPLATMLRNRTYEPDKPNSTSRITAVVRSGNGKPSAELLILEKSPFSDACNRRAYELALEPGFGYCITTYAGDGDPLPRFRGDPYLLPVGNIEDTLDAFWNALNADNRVALAVKAIDLKTRGSMIFVENRFEKVAPQLVL